MKKILLSIILWYALVLAGGFSFAQESPSWCSTQTSICGTAPAEFTLLVDFVREMTNSMKTIGTKWDYVWQYVNPNRFEGNEFVPPVQNVVSRTARNIAQKFSFGVASTAIFSNPLTLAGGKDLLWWVVLLAKHNVFLRDTKVLENIESLLASKKYELGVWWWRYAEINQSNLAMMEDILTSYKDKWLFTAVQLSPGAKYSDVVSLLTKVVASAKTFLYVGTTSQFDDISRWWDETGIRVVFDGTTIDAFAAVYDCVRWPEYICSSEMTSFLSGIQQIWSDNSSSMASTWNESLSTITESSKRLWEIFSSAPSDDFAAREADLLRSVYGNATIKTSSWRKWLLIDPFAKTRDDVKDSVQEIVDDVTDVWNDMRTFWQFPKSASNKITVVTSFEEVAYDDSQENFEKILNGYLADVVVAHAQDQEDVHFVTSVENITPAFAVLWSQLDAIDTKILWGKDVPNSLIQNLWRACQLQCGNKWGLCR